VIDENVEIGLTNKNRIARNESAGWVGISGDEEVLPDLIPASWRHSPLPITSSYKATTSESVRTIGTRQRAITSMSAPHEMVTKREFALCKLKEMTTQKRQAHRQAHSASLTGRCSRFSPRASAPLR